MNGPNLLDVARMATGNYIRTHPAAWSRYEDILSDACLGAVSAAARYEDGHGATVATYAYRRADGAILDGVRGRCTIRRCDHARGVTHPDQLPPHRQQPIPLDSLGAEFREPTAPSMEDAVADADLVQRMLATCTERERLILSASLLHGYTLTVIAEHLGVTVSAVSQQRTAAMSRLRAQFADCRLDAA